MVRPVIKTLTLNDLYRLPDDGSRHELTQGRLVSEPPPGVRHGRIITSLAFALESYVQSRGSGVVITADSGFVLSRNPDTVRAPDVAFVRRTRYMALLDERGPFLGPPDLAVEVLSPGDRRAGIESKVADYLDNGTMTVWLLDPERQEARIRECNAETVLDRGQSLASSALLPDFALALAPLFRRPWSY